MNLVHHHMRDAFQRRVAQHSPQHNTCQPNQMLAELRANSFSSTLLNDSLKYALLQAQVAGLAAPESLGHLTFCGSCNSCKSMAA